MTAAKTTALLKRYSYAEISAVVLRRITGGIFGGMLIELATLKFCMALGV
jgi:hypothetical protein